MNNIKILLLYVYILYYILRMYVKRYSNFKSKIHEGRKSTTLSFIFLALNFTTFNETK